MMSEVKKEEIKDNLRIYEVGYLLAPTVSEEKLGEEVALMKSLIEERGGIFISEDMPRMKPLAYSVSKVVGAKRNHFQQAYFGWMKFEFPYGEVENLKEALEKNQNIIRLLLIQTVRESTLATLKPSPLKRSDTQKKEVLSEEEIEKSIEKLVSETGA